MSILTNRWKINSSKNDCKFCPYCTATGNNLHNFDQWDKFTENTNIENIFEITGKEFIYCLLHANLRITGKLLKLLLQEAEQQNKLSQLSDAIQTNVWKCFNAFKFKTSNGWKVVGFNGNRCLKLLKYYENIVSEVTTDTNTFEIWRLWKSIYGTLNSRDQLNLSQVQFKDISYLD